MSPNQTAQLLETLPFVQDVAVTASAGASDDDFAQWHSDNVPFRLPADLVAFYTLADGLQLTFNYSQTGQFLFPGGCVCGMSVGVEGPHWTACDSVTAAWPGNVFIAPSRRDAAVFCVVEPLPSALPHLLIHPTPVPSPSPDGDTVPLGDMRLNPLSDIVSIATPRDVASSETCQPAGLPAAACPTTTPTFPDEPMFDGMAFSIDDSVKSGTVAMVYAHGIDEPPSFWFRDRACAWYLLARSFSDFLRLQVSHAGLPMWHYAYTAAGVDPVSRQWLAAVLPARLAIDDEGWHRRFAGEKEDGKDDDDS